MDDRKLVKAEKWRNDVLKAYNIDVSVQEARQFFGHDTYSTPIHTLDPRLLSSIDGPIDPNLPEEISSFLVYLKSATRGGVPSVGEFTEATLRVMGYRRDHYLSRSFSVPFTMCGEKTTAHIDVGLRSVNDPYMMILLLVQDDEKLHDQQELQASLIAKAIATFQDNNNRRLQYGLPPLDVMNIPCITMKETHPCFYKVPVTKELSDAVATGQFPDHPTTVTSCFPQPVSPPDVGMDNMEYRRIALQYFATFYELAEGCWSGFVGGPERGGVDQQ